MHIYTYIIYNVIIYILYILYIYMNFLCLYDLYDKMARNGSFKKTFFKKISYILVSSKTFLRHSYICPK